jgi:hypothetical protein
VGCAGFGFLVIPLLRALEAARRILFRLFVKRESQGLNIDKLPIRLSQDQLGEKGKDRREGGLFEN